MGILKNVFDPRSIALIGATDKEGAVGRTLLINLLKTKGRRIFPVNPSKKTLFGRDCFEGIAAIESRIDLAVIATPAKEVPQLVEQCGQAGIGGVVIISSGFKETDEGGSELTRQVSATRKKYGMRILGPNSVGYVRPNVGLNATIMKTEPPSADIAFISQSGALGSAILDWAVDEHFGFSMFATLGSMIDVDFGDLIDFLGEDEYTRSILMYMEDVGNARKFMSAARAFAIQKPIIIVRPGRHPDDMAYDAAFRRVGVLRVREISDLFDAAKVLDSRRLPRGERLAIVTCASGEGAMAADALLNLGGELAQLSPESMEELNQSLPPSWSKTNPVDILENTDTARYGLATKICLRDPGVDGVLVIYVPIDTAPPDEVAKAVIETAEGMWKPTITAWMGGEEVRAARQMLTKNNIPAYATPEEAVRTYINMYRYGRNLELLYETPAELPVQKTPRKDRLKELIQKTLQEGRTLLNEKESKTFLSNYGIPTVVPHIAKTISRIIVLAQKVGYPVVIKIVSPDIIDKSAIGCVIVGITSEEQLKFSYDTLLSRVKERAPHARIEGISLEKMVEGIDYELTLGSRKDKDFGAVILFGMGGVTAELIGDYAIGLPPLNQTLAKRLMEETKAYKLIQGWRGKPPAHLEELTKTIVNFSNLIVDFPEIAAIDINPLAIAQGRPCVLDARIVLDNTSVESVYPYPHLVITPYPTRYVMPWKLPGGTRVTLRPIKPEDEPLEREFLASLSQETLRTRFFSDMIDLSHNWFVMFCNIDYDRHIAMVAEIKRKEKRRIIAVVRIVINTDFNSGEFAILIHDKFQGKGLGRKLTETAIEIARWRGLREIYGEVLTRNQKMLGMCRKLGFTATYDSGGITKITLPLK